MFTTPARGSRLANITVIETVRKIALRNEKREKNRCEKALTSNCLKIYYNKKILFSILNLFTGLREIYWSLCANENFNIVKY